MTFDASNIHAQELARTLLTLQSAEEYELFLRDLCTEQELRMLTGRLEIARMIYAGLPYRVIMAKTGASTTTIARVARAFTYGQDGLRLACKRVKEENSHN